MGRKYVLLHHLRCCRIEVWANCYCSNRNGLQYVHCPEQCVQSSSRPKQQELPNSPSVALTCTISRKILRVEAYHRSEGPPKCFSRATVARKMFGCVVHFVRMKVPPNMNIDRWSERVGCDQKASGNRVDGTHSF